MHKNLKCGSLEMCVDALWHTCMIPNLQYNIKLLPAANKYICLVNCRFHNNRRNILINLILKYHTVLKHFLLLIFTRLIFLSVIKFFVQC